MQIASLFLATFLTGLMAGIFFTWTNAVTPGIGKLSDLEYLSALQSMNRVILNPAFYIAFFGPVILLPLATMLNYYSNPGIIFKLLILAAIFYLLGVFLVTVIGNIPLNNLLDKSKLESISLGDAKILRAAIEKKWNNFNLIRSITSAISFLLLTVSCLLMTK